MDVLPEKGREGWQLRGNLPLAVICIHWKLGRAETEERLLSAGVSVHITASRMSNEGREGHVENTA
jgi:hypothetical protein